MKILVCSDGSERARKALQMAAVIARARQADVTILGITENQADEDAIVKSLQEAQHEFQNQGLSVEISSKFGEPIREIARRTQEIKYDMVLIGAQRKGREGSYLLSDKTYAIIQAIAPPVLVAMGFQNGLKRILFCTRGKKFTNNAVRYTADLAKDLSASVTLLHVDPLPAPMHSQMLKIEEDVEQLLRSNSELGRNLRIQKQIIQRVGVRAEVRLRQGIVIDAIQQELEEGNYDLVVACSWAVRDALSNYVLGDVTRQVVNRIDRPVLIIRNDRGPRSLFAWLKSLRVRHSES